MYSTHLVCPENLYTMDIKDDYLPLNFFTFTIALFITLRLVYPV